MAMSTASGIARSSAQKLKQLSSDAISIPSPQELYRRKTSEIEDAKAKLANIVQRQLKIDKNQQRSVGDTDALLAEKREWKAKLGRLYDEAATLKWQFAPPPKLSPQQQFLADALKFEDVYAHRPRATAEKIAEAAKAVDALVHEYKLTQPTGNAGEAWAAKYHAAHLRLAVRRGLPYSARTLRFFSKETLAAARKAEGLE